MKKIFSKTLMACAVTAAVGFGGSAMAQTAPTVFPDFRVNEASVVGTLPNAIFTADKITGNYVEIITFSGAPSAGTFDVSLKWNAGQFVANNGNDTVSSQLGNPPLAGQTPPPANQYGLYALYQGKGTYTSNGTQTTFSFTPGGSLRVFTDANLDTSFGEPTLGTTAWTTGNTSDDRLLATGAPFAGEGNLNPALSTCGAGGGRGINCGSFGTSTTFELTADGRNFFVAPSPFYQLSFQSGQLNNFSPSGTQRINGSLDVVFDVPEPTSVALLGLGLIGLGLSRRRSKKA